MLYLADTVYDTPRIGGREKFECVSNHFFPSMAVRHEVSDQICCSPHIGWDWRVRIRSVSSIHVGIVKLNSLMALNSWEDRSCKHNSYKIWFWWSGLRIFSITVKKLVSSSTPDSTAHTINFQSDFRIHLLNHWLFCSSSSPPLVNRYKFISSV